MKIDRTDGTDECKYLSVNQIAKSREYPFSLGQLRYYLTKRHLNGLDKSVRKIGKRIYVHKDFFEQWIESQSAIGGRP
jgi:hypothetical protein